MDIIGIIGNTVAGRKGFYETKRGEKKPKKTKLVMVCILGSVVQKLKS